MITEQRLPSRLKLNEVRISSITGDQRCCLAPAPSGMNPKRIDTERLSKIKKLYTGVHPPNGKMCVMEAVSYVAGEEWSDHPECACPVIGAFMRSWNDGLPDRQRSKLLLPFVPKLIGTRSGEAVEKRRACMSFDWLIRTHTVEWLRLAGLNSQAERLSSLPEITSFGQIPSICGPLETVRDAMRDAARATARDAVRGAALSAALSAGRGAARDAALSGALSAALVAAVDVALDAARDVAVAAALAAASKKLEPTKLKLQRSAVNLLNRMIEAK